MRKIIQFGILAYTRLVVYFNSFRHPFQDNTSTSISKYGFPQKHCPGILITEVLTLRSMYHVI